jgi:dephospho-CoA kinase
MIIGVCGKSNSGKSFLATKLCERLNGYKVVNGDAVGHDVIAIEEVKKELVNAFGDNVLKDGVIDRKVLGKIVFNDESEMNKLNDITWPYMSKIFENNIEEGNKIIDWALLSKTEYFERCDIKILVDVPYEIRLYRAVMRDGITKAKFDEREKASATYNKNEFDIVVSIGDEMNMEELINNILNKINYNLELK